MYLWKTLKVFISSTFKDLESERDGLAVVVNNLKEKLFSQRLHLVLYDLRWQDRSHNKDLVSWCLDTVGQSEYFIAILGCRYGWRPPTNYDGSENIHRLSITEMEIDYALEKIDPKKRIFFFGEQEQYKEKLATEAKEDLNSLEKLKNKLQEKGERIFIFNNEAEVTTKIEQQLFEMFRSHYPHEKESLETFTIHQSISEIVSEKGKGFVGRGEYLQKLVEFSESGSNENYLVVSAVAGTGKSALLAHFIKHLKTQNLFPVLVHYVSMAGVTRDNRGILQSFYQQLKSIGWMGDVPLDKLLIEMRDVLESSKEKLIIAIDGLDEMEESSLSWLPSNLPSNIRVIITTRPVEIYNEVLKFPQVETFELPPLKKDEITEITTKYIEERDLEINSNEKEFLIERASGNPLFLKVALDELAAGGIAVAQMAETVDVLFRQILARLEGKYGKDLLHCYLGVIAASRNGIAEAELYEIIRFAANDIKNNIVLELAKQLANFVVQREKLFHFFHPEFERSIKILFGKKGMRNYHEIIGKYMLRKGFAYERALFELAYQLQWSENYELLLQTLTDIEFIEKKCLNDMVLDLQQDLHRAISENAVLLPEDLKLEIAQNVTVSFHTIRLLQNALEIDIQHIFRYPQQVFGTFWNRLFWYDSPEAQNHYVKYNNPPWKKKNEDKVFLLMEHWREKMESKGNIWLKALRPLPERVDSPLMKVIRGHEARIGQLLLRKDRLFSCSTDKTIKVWDIKNGNCLLSIPTDEEVISICLAEDGKTLFIGAKDFCVSIWDLDNHKLVRKLEGHTDWVRRIILDPTEKRIFSASKDKTIKVWDLDTYTCVNTIHHHTSCVNDIVLHNDHVFSCSDDRTIRIWDLKQNQSVKVLHGHKDTIRRICLTKDGTTLVSGSYDRTLKIWNAKTGQCIQTIDDHDAAVLGLTLTKNEKFIISGGSSKDKTIKIWDRNGKCISTFTGHENGIEDVITDENDKFIISSSKDRTIRIWDLEEDSSFYELDGHSSRLSNNIVNENGTHIVSSSQDGIVKLWSAEKGNCLFTLEHDELIWRVYLNPEGSKVFSTSHDGHIYIWDTNTGNCLTKIKAHDDRINQLCFDLTYDRFVSSSRADSVAKVWDVNSGECLYTSSNHESPVFSTHFADKKNKVITGTKNGFIKIWDLKTGQDTILGQHEGIIWTFGMDQEQSRLISGGYDSLAKIWNIDTRECLQVLKGHESILWSGFLEENRAITNSKDGTIRFWDIATANCLDSVQGIFDTAQFSWLKDYYVVNQKADTTILSRKTNLPILRFPIAVNNAMMSKNGIVCGRIYNQIYILKLQNI